MALLRLATAMIALLGSGIDRYAQQRLWNAMCGNGTVEICCDSQRRGCEMDCEAKAKNRLAPRGHGDAMFETERLG